MGEFRAAKGDSLIIFRQAFFGAIVGLTLIGSAHASCSDETIKKTWTQLYDLYERQPDCDDGAVAEDNDESVKEILLHSSNFSELGRLVRKTPAFGDFIIRHASKSNVFFETGDTQKIIDNMEKNCSAKEAAFCDRLVTASQ